MADGLPSLRPDPYTAALIPSLDPPLPPQTSTELILQRYALGLEKDHYVRTEDYISRSPAYGMARDDP